MTRYAQLLKIIDACKPKTIVEVGTWNGVRAIEMCAAALQHSDRVHYTGFDLFEEASDDHDARELNVKAHYSLQDVERALRSFQEDNPGFSFDLVKGDTRKTLGNGHEAWCFASPPDLAFIDGGHSIETIANDYEALKSSKVVVFDDYYDPQDGHPDISKYGCNKLVESMESIILPLGDPVKGGGMVRMAVTPVAAWPEPISMVVKTRNCVPSEDIVSNIRTNVPRIERWVEECKRHDNVAVIVSGGPSYRDYIGNIREHLKNGHFVFCVKTSHDTLIENGIVPFGCMLLDPRNHVLDYVGEPHKDVRYFTASMVHPSTLDRLIETGSKVIGYNAAVGAEETSCLAEYGEHILISGGSTAAIRGVSVLHALGFREFHMYGFESCYAKKPTKEGTHGIKKKEPLKVSVFGRKFWTDPELVAQSQDFEKLIEVGEDIELHVYGDGIIPHIWNCTRRTLGNFMDVMNA